MIGWLHRRQSELVDTTAFAAIGFWQLLGRAGCHGLEEWNCYAEGWLEKGPGEFFRVPEKIPDRWWPGGSICRPPWPVIARRTTACISKFGRARRGCGPRR